MSEPVKLNLDKAISVLLGNNDEERLELIKQYRSSIKPVTGLICRTLINGTSEEINGAICCLAKISEIESQIILDILKEESAAKDIILLSVRKFIHSNNQSKIEEANINFIRYSLTALVNITREEICDQMVKSLLIMDDNKLLQGFHIVLSNLVDVASHGEDFPELIVQLLLNVSRSSVVLKEIQNDRENLASLLKVLLQYFEQSINSKIRVSCLSIVVNFLISGSAQETILDSKLELISKVLYPLAGPTANELDDEDMAKLPLDLQYLPPETEREADNCVRDALISCLLLCCHTRNGRNCLKDNGAYYILRELHKWEKDRTIQKRIEDVVDILIKEEYEFDEFPNLIKTQIPEHLIGKFDEMDQNLLTD